ncbi:hypothetical protein BJ138DRAFT_650540 [Hygrophoropsis aurantiaca]|uniref:Uncharacterized protein n=1 Tax=Hygrophoropsis aurantiaca TaxID=72124 RepID=A0ACB8A001_9AGAM|nr:hypothetical protein BJ138DRAFT_650540 [Hygrophoropsis aurantiaca]
MASTTSLQTSTGEPSPTFGYPNIKPEHPFEKMVARLDKETFDFNRYSAVDNAIVYSLFSKKSRRPYRAALHLAKLANFTMPTPSQGTEIPEICQAVNSEYPSEEECKAVTSVLMEKFGDVFASEDEPIIQHLLLRYTLLHSRYSVIELDKVSFFGQSVTGNIKARSDIAADTFLLSVGGSMSKQTAETKEPPTTHGPFGFVTHDCNPNAQVYPINNAQASTFRTIRDIKEGELITAAFAKQDPDAKCLCATCNPKAQSNHLVSVSQGEHGEGEVNQTSKKRKKIRGRGGRKKLKTLVEAGGVVQPQESGDMLVLQSDVETPAL